MAPKYLRNTGQSWSADEDRLLRRLVRENTPTRVIGLKLGRSEAAIHNRAAALGLSLKPVNQSPYNRRPI